MLCMRLLDYLAVFYAFERLWCVAAQSLSLLIHVVYPVLNVIVRIRVREHAVRQ